MGRRRRRWEIGPGEYVGTELPEPRKPRHRQAPFSSTVDRGPEGAEAPALSTPAPGSYDVKVPHAYDKPPAESGPFSVARVTAPFQSTAERTTGPAVVSGQPGPGQYDVAAPRGRMEACKTLGPPEQKPKLTMLYLSAPSIPVTSQSFGYEEGGGARLVRQKAPSGWSGRHHDSIGPDHYKPDDYWSRPNKFSGCRFGRAHRQMVKLPGGLGGVEPGPGAYEPKRPKGERMLRASAVFASRSEKPGAKPPATEKEVDTGPGPGHYRIHRANWKGPSPPEDLQFFGSSNPRFQGGFGGASRIPGPGAYPDPPGALAESKAAVIQPVKWNVSKMRPDTPVTPPEIMAPDMAHARDNARLFKTQTFSVMASCGLSGFCSQSRRLPRRNVDEDSQPGPAHYAPGRRRRIRYDPSYAFCSGSEKLLDTAKSYADLPAPNAYDPQKPKANTVRRLRVKKEGFLAQSQRFEAKKRADAAPGPGNYKVVGDLEMRSFNRAQGGLRSRGLLQTMGFAAAADRFGSAAPEAKPGPGAYMVESNWNTRTFNSLFGFEI